MDCRVFRTCLNRRPAVRATEVPGLDRVGRCRRAGGVGVHAGRHGQRCVRGPRWTADRQGTPAARRHGQGGAAGQAGSGLGGTPTRWIPGSPRPSPPHGDSRRHRTGCPAQAIDNAVAADGRLRHGHRGSVPSASRSSTDEPWCRSRDARAGRTIRSRRAHEPVRPSPQSPPRIPLENWPRATVLRTPQAQDQPGMAVVSGEKRGSSAESVA